MTDFKTYLKIEHIKAKPFSDDMIAGFKTRYATQNEDGSFSTYGFPTDEQGEEELKVPYIICPATQRQILAGEGYMVLENKDGSYRAIASHIFDKIYTRGVFPTEDEIEQQAKDIFEPDVPEYNNSWGTEVYSEGAAWAIMEISRRIESNEDYNG
jgi:hypothetical protein